MTRITIDADSETDAMAICLRDYGFYPAAVREVDSGDEDTRAWMCFEYGDDADLWDRQI